MPFLHKLASRPDFHFPRGGGFPCFALAHAEEPLQNSEVKLTPYFK